jgi:hypothetical protein
VPSHWFRRDLAPSAVQTHCCRRPSEFDSNLAPFDSGAKLDPRKSENDQDTRNSTERAIHHAASHRAMSV